MRVFLCSSQTNRLVGKLSQKEHNITINSSPNGLLIGVKG